MDAMAGCARSGGEGFPDLIWTVVDPPVVASRVARAVAAKACRRRAEAVALVVGGMVAAVVVLGTGSRHFATVTLMIVSHPGVNEGTTAMTRSAKVNIAALHPRAGGMVMPSRAMDDRASVSRPAGRFRRGGIRPSL